MCFHVLFFLKKVECRKVFRNNVSVPGSTVNDAILLGQLFRPFPKKIRRKGEDVINQV